jgi:LysR family glycine cleavage system transcriptional activator
MRLGTRPRDLNIKTHPTFAIRWLIPRLHRFQTLHPEIQVRLTTSSVNVDFFREYFDLAVTYNPGEKPGIRQDPLLREKLAPVCAPALLEKGQALQRPEDLGHFRLLHNNPDQREWRQWARAVGVKNLDFDKGQVFEIDDAALQAATAGLGIALGDLLLVREDLDSGRLVRPLACPPVETGSYCLAFPSRNAEESGISAFRDWIFSEMARDIPETGWRQEEDPGPDFAPGQPPH